MNKEEIKNRIDDLQQQSSSLAAARQYLQQLSLNAIKGLAEITEQLPGLLVSISLGETPESALEEATAKMQRLQAMARVPTAEALMILNRRSSTIAEKLNYEVQLLAAIEHKARYINARTAIAAKGFFTAQEHDELQALASISGDGQDFRHFTYLIEKYRGDRENSGNRADYPPFVYIPAAA